MCAFLHACAHFHVCMHICVCSKICSLCVLSAAIVFLECEGVYDAWAAVAAVVQRWIVVVERRRVELLLGIIERQQVGNPG